MGKSHWPTRSCPRSKRECCVWQIATFLDSICGKRLWRVKTNLRLPCEKRLSDGSYLSTIYRSDKDRRQGNNGIRVRVIEYTLEGVANAEPIYRFGACEKLTRSAFRE